uniref:Uncharacterized protein n=1 Tax=viral metagenome TaxID=1070528 RepID=A0A6C0BMR4_9ZZZZ
MSQGELEYNEAIERVYDITSKFKPPGMDTNIIGDTMRTVMNMSRVKESLMVGDSNDTSNVGGHVRDILEMDEVKDILTNMNQSQCHNPTPQDTLKQYISKLRSKIEVAERLLLDPSITLSQVNLLINDKDDTDDDLLSLVLSSGEDEQDKIVDIATDFVTDITTSDAPVYHMFSALLKMSSMQRESNGLNVQEIEEVNDHSTHVEDIVDEVD